MTAARSMPRARSSSCGGPSAPAGLAKAVERTMARTRPSIARRGHGGRGRRSNMGAPRRRSDADPAPHRACAAREAVLRGLETCGARRSRAFARAFSRQEDHQPEAMSSCVWSSWSGPCRASSFNDRRHSRRARRARDGQDRQKRRAEHRFVMRRDAGSQQREVLGLAAGLGLDGGAVVTRGPRRRRAARIEARFVHLRAMEVPMAAEHERGENGEDRDQRQRRSSEPPMSSLEAHASHRAGGVPRRVSGR